MNFQTILTSTSNGFGSEDELLTFENMTDLQAVIKDHVRWVHHMPDDRYSTSDIDEWFFIFSSGIVES